MALAFSVATRNNEMDEITAVIDGGAGAGVIKIYDGSRPATGGTATTLLATLTFSDPSFPAASSAAITASSITDETSATAGTATWFRIEDSVGTFVCDGDVGTSGSDLNLNTVTIGSGATVSITSMVLTAGNP